MTGTERCLAVLEGRLPDRVPISTYELVGFNPDSFENREASYARLMAVIRRDTDCFYRWSARWPLPPGCGAGHFLSASPAARLEVKTWREGADEVKLETVHTPKGPLTRRTRVRPGIHTVWTEEHFVKTAEDLAAVLSVPYEPMAPDCSTLALARKRVGERGIVKTSIGDALCHACELFEFGEFTVWALTERAAVRRLLDAFHVRVMDRLRAQLAAGVGPLWRLVGAEYATPPYMPPELFAEYVVPYQCEMSALIHQYGGFARMHCHGKISRVLDHILAAGVDALDPVEPPPQGDLELAEAKRRLGGRVTIMGNLELALLETATPEQVRAEVRRTMAAGKPGGRFVIMPTAAPIDVPLRQQTEENYLAFIETANELAAY